MQLQEVLRELERQRGSAKNWVEGAFIISRPLGSCPFFHPLIVAASHNCLSQIFSIMTNRAVLSFLSCKGQAFYRKYYSVSCSCWCTFKKTVTLLFATMSVTCASQSDRIFLHHTWGCLLSCTSYCNFAIMVYIFSTYSLIESDNLSWSSVSLWAPHSHFKSLSNSLLISSILPLFHLCNKGKQYHIIIGIW